MGTDNARERKAGRQKAQFLAPLLPAQELGAQTREITDADGQQFEAQTGVVENQKINSRPDEGPHQGAQNTEAEMGRLRR